MKTNSQLTKLYRDAHNQRVSQYVADLHTRHTRLCSYDDDSVLSQSPMNESCRLE